MLANPLKKNKINLTDYPYQKDIEYRLLMAELSVFDVELLTEIIHGSLKSKIGQIADYLEVNQSQVVPSLEKLKKTGLYRIEKDTIIVNKEMRKYWETQIPKFSDHFRADIEFIRDLLTKVPIHVLPVWYSISRTSDDIFQSIVEKYFYTPKIYQRYLDDLTFDEPILNQIAKDVFHSPDFKIQAKTLIEKYKLSRETFEEYMLQLELNLVCFLSYNQEDDRWVEVVTPFHEWRQLLRFQRDSNPETIQDKSQIQRNHPDDFGFVRDLTTLMHAITNSSLPTVEQNGSFTISLDIRNQLFPHLLQAPNADSYLIKLIQTAEQFQLIQVANDCINLKQRNCQWFEKSIQEQAISLYRYFRSQNPSSSGGYIDRNLRETEKCLKKIANSGWIYLDDFIKICSAPIGDNKPVSLTKKGKRWKYQLPEYTEDDQNTLTEYIEASLFQAGIVATGVHNGKRCFIVTPFGRMTLD